MTTSAAMAPDREMKLTALLVIGSMLWFGVGAREFK